MITNKDIRIAVNQQLAKTGVEITSRDVEEGFNRPSFFVQLDNVNRSGSLTQIERYLTVRIYYFPSDPHDYSIEVLDIQDELENLFDLKLKVKDRWLNVEEFNSFVNDGVLQCSFDMEFETARDAEYDAIIIDVDDEGNPVDRDEDGNPIDDEGNPVDEDDIGSIEVPIDDDGNPVTDKDGKPIPIELMEYLHLNKE